MGIFIWFCFSMAQLHAGDLAYSDKFPPRAAESSVKIIKTDGTADYNPYFVQHHDGDPSNFHLLGMICDPFVIYEVRPSENGQIREPRYRMWFSAYQKKKGNENYEQGIAYAESPDGLTWSDPKSRDDEINLIFAPQGSDAQKTFFGFNYETPAIVRHPKNGRYYLFYSGQAQKGQTDQDIPYFIGLAVSKDGITGWTRYGAVFTPKEPWEQPYPARKGFAGGVMEPSVIYDKKEGVFKMWYAALGKKDGIWSGRIGYATSEDGIHWPDDQRRKDPVFTVSQELWDSSWVSQTHVVQDPDKGFHLFYAARSSDEQTYGIGHAYSTDGIRWSRNPNNPILKNQSQSWHSQLTGGPSVIFKDGNIQLWFFGSKQESFSRVYFGWTQLKMGTPGAVPAMSTIALVLTASFLLSIGVWAARKF